MALVEGLLDEYAGVFLIFGAIAVLLAVLVVPRLYVIVPGRHVAVVERWGEFRRTLLPGINRLMWPSEELRVAHWSHRGQNGRQVPQSLRFFPIDEREMDTPPYNCLSRDQMMVKVDGTVQYAIRDVRKAINATPNPLGLLEQSLQQAVRTVIARHPVSELQGRDVALGEEIVRHVNGDEGRFAETYGIHCSRFIVQSISMDPAILRTNQEIHTRARQAEMQLQTQRTEHERRCQELEFAKEKQRLELELERERAAAALERLQGEARAKAAAESAPLRAFLEAGFTARDYVELERVRALAQYAGGAQRVLAPIEWFSRKRVTLDNEMEVDVSEK